MQKNVARLFRTVKLVCCAQKFPFIHLGHEWHNLGFDFLIILNQFKSKSSKEKLNVLIFLRDL